MKASTVSFTIPGKVMATSERGVLKSLEGKKAMSIHRDGTARTPAETVDAAARLLTETRTDQRQVGEIDSDPGPCPHCGEPRVLTSRALYCFKCGVSLRGVSRKAAAGSEQSAAAIIEEMVDHIAKSAGVTRQGARDAFMQTDTGRGLYELHRLQSAAAVE